MEIILVLKGSGNSFTTNLYCMRNRKLDNEFVLKHRPSVLTDHAEEYPVWRVLWHAFVTRWYTSISWNNIEAKKEYFGLFGHANNRQQSERTTR